ncbi:hypothetical protein ACFC6L_16195 [Kitasatospora phosalacinea]|uniref:hypothetical protein n=1 Tax=Kitasatospora phosalacinea TaxID=2065 RepID=UPI0035D62568
MSIAGVAVAAVQVAIGGGMVRFGVRLQQSMRREGAEFSDLRLLRRMRLLVVMLGSGIACLGVFRLVPSPWDRLFVLLAVLLALAVLTVAVAEAVRFHRAGR